MITKQDALIISPRTMAILLPEGLLSDVFDYDQLEAKSNNQTLTNQNKTDNIFYSFDQQSRHRFNNDVWRDNKSPIPSTPNTLFNSFDNSSPQSSMRDVSLLESPDLTNSSSSANSSGYQSRSMKSQDGIQLVTHSGAKFVIRNSYLAEKLLLRPIRRAFISALSCWIRFCDESSLTRLDKLRLQSRSLWAEMSARSDQLDKRSLFKHQVTCIIPPGLLYQDIKQLPIDPAQWHWSDEAENEWMSYMLTEVNDTSQYKRAIDCLHLLQEVTDQAMMPEPFKSSSSPTVPSLRLDDKQQFGTSDKQNNLADENSGEDEFNDDDDDDDDDGIEVGVGDVSLIGPYSCKMTPNTRQKAFGSGERVYTAAKQTQETVLKDLQRQVKSELSTKGKPSTELKPIKADKAMLDEQTPQELNIRYKTRLCLHFINSTTGFCPSGASCGFAHGIDELRMPNSHPKFKTKVCQHFAETNGSFCPYGDKCNFIHRLNSLKSASLPETTEISNSREANREIKNQDPNKSKPTINKKRQGKTRTNAKKT